MRSYPNFRALVLQGGGALGAYEAGVLSVLIKYLRIEDEKNGEENRLFLMSSQGRQ